MKFLSTAMLALMLSSGCQPKTAPPDPPAPPSPQGRLEVELTAEAYEYAQIELLAAQKSRFAPQLQVAATLAVDPQKFASVGARVAGRVAAIRVTPGQQVEQGQALVEVEAVELHQISTEYLIAASRHREARDVLRRMRRLVAERVGALQDLRHAEANAEAAKATYSEAEEHLHFLGLDDDAIAAMRLGTSHGTQTSIVRAPMGGRIATLSISLGQVLSGTETLVTIVDSDQIWAMLKVYERDVCKVACGQNARLKLLGFGDRVFCGKVKAVGDVVDPLTHTVDLRLSLPNPSWALKPGMSGIATIALAEDQGTAWLPAEAVQSFEDKKVIFVRLQPRKFRAIPVTAGEERSGLVPIQPAPADATEVVVRGAFTLRGVLERNSLGEG